MNIEISSKLYRRFQNLEECEDLSEQEIEEYAREIIEDFLEDFIIERLAKQEDIYGEEENDDQ
jgi:hypothetical protein